MDIWYIKKLKASEGAQDENTFVGGLEQYRTSLTPAIDIEVAC